MDTRSADLGTVSTRAGTATLGLGLLFLAATIFIFVLSLSDLVDPPTWVRVLGLVWLPLGFFGAPLTYAVARAGPGRNRGRLGLALMLVPLAAFVALLFVAG